MTECTVYHYESILDGFGPIDMHAMDHACSENCMSFILDRYGVPRDVQHERRNQELGADANENHGVLSWGVTPCVDYGDAACYCGGCGVLLSRDHDDTADCHDTPIVVGRIDHASREECETCGVVLKVNAADVG